MNLSDGQQHMLDEIRAENEEVEVLDDQAFSGTLPEPGGVLVFAGPARKAGYAMFDSQHVMITERGEGVPVVLAEGKVDVATDEFMDPEAPPRD